MNEPSSHQKTGYDLSGELPKYYSDPVLQAMLCNPYRLFVYWELPDDAVETGSRLLLRLFESGLKDTEEAETASEIEIPPGSCSRYIDVPFPGLAYTIELIKVLPDGSRRRLLLAQQTVPPAAPDYPSAFAPRQSLDASEAGKDISTRSPLGRHEEKTPAKPGFSPPFNLRLTGHSSWSLPGSSAP